MSALRVAGILLLASLYHQVSLAQWICAYFLTGVIGAAFAIQQGSVLWGIPRLSYRAMREDVREGCFFSVSTSAQTVYNDIDKTMLAHYSTFSVHSAFMGPRNGLLTRVSTPIRALVSAAYPQFFRIGAAGIGPAYSYAKRLIHKAPRLWMCGLHRPFPYRPFGCRIFLDPNMRPLLQPFDCSRLSL